MLSRKDATITLAGFDPSQHPHIPKGSPGAGRWLTTGGRHQDASKHPRMRLTAHTGMDGAPVHQIHFAATRGAPLGGKGLAAERALAHIRERHAGAHPGLEAKLEGMAQAGQPGAHELEALHELHRLYGVQVRGAGQHSADRAPVSARPRLRREQQVIAAYTQRHGYDVSPKTIRYQHLNTAERDELANVVRGHLAQATERETADALRGQKGDKSAVAQLRHDIARHPDNIDEMPVGGEGLRAERALAHLQAEVARHGGEPDAATAASISKLRERAAGIKPNRDDLNELYALHSIYQHELGNPHLPASSRARLQRETAVIKSYVKRHVRWGGLPRDTAKKDLVRGPQRWQGLKHEQGDGRGVSAESFAHLHDAVQTGLRQEAAEAQQHSEGGARMRDISAVYRRPIQLSEPGADGKRRSWIMYLPQGVYHHPDYGTLHFSRAMLDEVKRHFDESVREIEIALDLDHQASRDSSAAPGWMERMELREAQGGDPAGLWALIRWTELGADLLQKEIYKYFSPEFGKHLDEKTGKKIPNVPFGGALTNRPFLKSMPAIRLSERDQLQRWLREFEGTRMKGKTAAQRDEDLDLDEETQTFDDMGDEYDEDAEDLEDGGDDEAEEGDDEEEAAPPKKPAAKGKGKAAKKMSEMRALPKVQLAEQYAMLEQRLARMDAERAVTKQIAAWAAGTFTFSEGGKGQKPARGSFAVTPRFERAYGALMLSEDVIALSEEAQAQVGKVIELALSNALVRTDRLGNSYDADRPRKQPGRKGAPGDTIALEEKAQELAAKAGKDFLALEFSERGKFYDQAARVIDYGKHSDED